MSDDPESRSFNVAPALTDEQAAELGHLVAWWGFLEYQTTVIATDLLGVSLEEGRVVFTQMNIRPRLQAISLLLPSRVIYQRRVAEFGPFRTRIEEAQAKRNLLVHGLWSVEEGVGHFVLQMWGGKDGINRIDVEPHPISQVELSATGGGIAMLAAELSKWWSELRHELRPSDYRDF